MIEGKAGTLYVATMDTGRFKFMAAGTTEVEVMEVMRKAWAEHVRVTGASYEWEDVAEAMEIHAMTPGMALRDGSPWGTS